MKQLSKPQTSNLQKIAFGIFTLVITCIAGLAFAGDSGGDISSITTKMQKHAGAIAQLLNIASYVAGVGFALAGILQFKAHKENPQQTPLSKPIVMIVVAASLLFLPTILEIAGASLFEGGKKAVEYKGEAK